MATTYNIGKNKWTQNNLNNNMSGTDANAIYYATHGGTGTGKANTQRSNPGSYVSYTPDKSSGGSGGGGGNDGGNSGGGDYYDPYGGGYYGDYYGGGYFDSSGVWEEYLERLQAQAEASYARNMETIANAYDRSAGSLNENFSSARDQMNQAANKSRGEINDDSEAAMRQAYINNRLSRRDLQQNLSALGMSGGASETTMASLDNNYGNARNKIDTQRNKSLSELESVLANNLAAALQQYNAQMSSLNQWRAQEEMAAEAALNNFEAGYAANFSSLAPSNDAYLAALNALQKSQQGFNFEGASANNPYQALSQRQAANMYNTNYAEYLAANSLYGNNATRNNAYSAYQNGRMSQEDLVTLINRLGL